MSKRRGNRAGARVQRGRATQFAASPYATEIVGALTPDARERFDALWGHRIVADYYAPDDLEHAPRTPAQALDWLDANHSWDRLVEPTIHLFSGQWRGRVRRAADAIEARVAALFGEEPFGATPEDVERYRLAMILAAAILSLPDALDYRDRPRPWERLSGLLLDAARNHKPDTVDPDVVIPLTLAEYDDAHPMPGWLALGLSKWWPGGFEFHASGVEAAGGDEGGDGA